MNALETKSHIIEEQERRFAYLLASRVIQKPKLSIWMILVPIIFVYFFIGSINTKPAATNSSIIL